MEASMATELEPLLTSEEVAKILRVSTITLQNWRTDRRKSRKRMPLPFVKNGGNVAYRPSDVAAYLDARTTQPGEGKRNRKPKRRAA
jgi:helix-turn-helix protein